MFLSEVECFCQKLNVLSEVGCSSQKLNVFIYNVVQHTRQDKEYNILSKMNKFIK